MHRREFLRCARGIQVRGDRDPVSNRQGALLEADGRIGIAEVIGQQSQVVQHGGGPGVRRRRTCASRCRAPIPSCAGPRNSRPAPTRRLAASLNNQISSGWSCGRTDPAISIARCISGAASPVRPSRSQRVGLVAKGRGKGDADGPAASSASAAARRVRRTPPGRSGRHGGTDRRRVPESRPARPARRGEASAARPRAFNSRLACSICCSWTRTADGADGFARARRPVGSGSPAIRGERAPQRGSLSSRRSSCRRDSPSPSSHSARRSSGEPAVAVRSNAR